MHGTVVPDGHARPRLRFDGTNMHGITDSTTFES